MAQKYLLVRENPYKGGGVGVPPDDEIWYRTSDGNPLVIYDVSKLNLLSNTYNEYGVLKFANKLTELPNIQTINLVSVSLPQSIETMNGMIINGDMVGYDLYYNCKSADIDSFNILLLMEGNPINTVYISDRVENISYNIGIYFSSYCRNILIVNNARYNRGNGYNCIIDSSFNRLLGACSNAVIPDDAFEYNDNLFGFIGRYYYVNGKYDKLWAVQIPNNFLFGVYKSDGYYDIDGCMCNIRYCRNANSKLENKYNMSIPPSQVLIVDDTCEGSITVIQEDLDNGTSHANVEYVAILSKYNSEQVFGKDVPYMCDISDRQIININPIDTSVRLTAGDCAVAIERIESPDGTYAVDDEDELQQIKDTVRKVYKKRVGDCVLLMNGFCTLHLPDDIIDLYIGQQPEQWMLISNMYCCLWNPEIVEVFGFETNTAVRRIHFACSIKYRIDNTYAGKLWYENFNDSTYTGTFIFDEGEFTLEQLGNYSYE